MAHVHHRDHDPHNNELTNIVLVPDPCPEHPLPDAWDDPRAALTDAFDLIVEVHRLTYDRLIETLTVEEVAAVDARVEEMRRRVSAITGEDR